MGNTGIAIIVTAFVLSVILVNLLPKFLKRKCPQCGGRNFISAGGAEYLRPDTWGNPRGTYTIYTCDVCKIAKVQHANGWDDLDYEKREEEAAEIVFGKSLEEMRKNG